MLPMTKIKQTTKAPAAKIIKLSAIYASSNIAPNKKAPDTIMVSSAISLISAIPTSVIPATSAIVTAITSAAFIVSVVAVDGNCQ